MNSFLIVSPDKKQREAYTLTQCDTLHISPFDRTIIIPEKSIGIEDIRTMQKKIFFKPLKGENKAIIFCDAHTATIETQNALLKTLEEPPPHTYLFLTASQTDTFLPTVLSRCKLITLTDTSETLDTESLKTLQREWQTLLTAPLGTKLKKAQDMAKEKDTALQWLRNSLFANRRAMILKLQTNQSLIDDVFLLQQLQKTYTLAKTTNINLRFLLEALLLALPQPYS